VSELVVTHNAGITSCLSVRLHEIVQFRIKKGRWPASVDSTAEFKNYWAKPKTPIDARLLRAILPECPDFPLPVFDCNHQYLDYFRLDPRIFPVAAHFCHPSAEVEQVSAEVAGRMADRTVVHYRGNDKVKERPRVSYEVALEAAEIVGGPYWVLTDELEFLEAFYTAFPNSDHLECLPAIKRNDSASARGGTPEDRPLFAVRFLAALYAQRHAKKMVVTTGNTSLWAVLWRGHARGVWQLR